MFAKRLLQKALHHHHHHHHRPNNQNVGGGLTSADVDVRTIIHYGIPSTASILAFDPIQRLLAIGTLDGRIKVVGGDNIEGLLISPKEVPYKYLEFIFNQGFLISITNDNEIQVWNLESRSIGSKLQWESNVTAFSIISGSQFMYVGDEYGLISVLKYDAENGELVQFPYHISSSSLQEAAGISFPSPQPIVGVLPQPCSSGNRVLIAYESGIIILWDIVEARIITLRGDRVLQLKNEGDSPSDAESGHEDITHQYQLDEKEITALCWASSDGSILAVGYVDGDILFWTTLEPASGKYQQSGLSHTVVKLQLSSAEKRLPIIVLHWWESDESRRNGVGQLLIYGGDEIGGDEVVTVLSLEWSSGRQNLRCLGRMVLKLGGSFADAILITNSGVIDSDETVALFVLTSPGKLQVFDGASFSASLPHKEKKLVDSAVDLPAVIPTTNPCMTMSKLFCLPKDLNLSKTLLELAALKKFNSTSKLSAERNWYLTGGVPNHLSLSREKLVERLYVAGYQDGSVRVWDATSPILSLLCVVDSETNGLNFAGTNAPVSKVDVCFQTLQLAVGSESGLVYLYGLSSSDETSFHFVTENKTEVHSLPRIEGPRRRAVFSLLNSRIQALKFSDSGAKLLVGYECAQIAVLDTKSLSTLFLTSSLSNPSSQLVSVVWNEFLHGHVKNLNDSASEVPNEQVEDYIFILTEDARIYIVNGSSGNMIGSSPLRQRQQSPAISIYIIESRIGNRADQSSTDHMVNDEPAPDKSSSENTKCENKSCSSENTSSGECVKDSYILLCSKNAVRVFTMKSVIQGARKSICKIKLAKPCCWTTTFVKDERTYMLVLLYQTGEIEIRSIPNLELVKAFSLMSALRWKFTDNMEKTISSTINGHIILVQGCEVALVSILARENDFRIPESLPILHDEVLAAASKAAFSISSNHKRKQGTSPSILGGIVKGFKGGKSRNAVDHPSFSHLESVFMKSPFPEVTLTSANEQVQQEDAELSIDDIKIDEPVLPKSTSLQNNEREKMSDRERLFGDGTTDAKPRVRTREEIIATYRKTGDASSVAGQARNKLLERQEKLEKISRQTEELRSGAEDFASLANELVKVMENRKWWQI